MPGEFELIDWLRRQTQDLPREIIRDIGDDAAILRSEEPLAVSKDLLVEGVHFRREWISPWLLGCKALRVNLSDLAAMSARPLACLLGLGLPKELCGAWFEPFMEGFLQETREYRCPLIGGDLSAAPSILVSVTVLGRVDAPGPIYRDQARAGDRIGLVGPVGRSRRALQLLSKRTFPGLTLVRNRAQLRKLGTDEETDLLHTHFLPEPQLEAGLWLGQRGLARASIDVSDGLAADLGKMAAASGLRAVLEAEALVPRGSGGEPSDLDIMLHGGEDYALLFSADQEILDQLRSEYPPQLPPFRVVGRFEPGQPGVWLDEDSQLRLIEDKGFDHFS